MFLVNIAVAEYNVIVAFVYAALGFFAERFKRFAQSFFTFAALEEHRKLDGVESLITNVAENIKLRICKDRVGQTHHLAVRFVGRKDSRTNTTDIFGQRHYQRFADRVDGRVGYLGKLLAEIVEEYLSMAREYSQWCVVTH